MTDKRKRIQELVNTVMVNIDPSMVNAKKYQDIFSKMNDQQFAEWIEKFLADPKANLRIDIEEFNEDVTRVLKFENIEKAAEAINLPLFEYVYVPHVSSDPNRPIRTKQKVLVGNLNIKRPQQLVSKKTGLTMSDTDRDDISGGAKGDSKGGKTTGIENELLAGVGADEVISEFSGARGDNMVEYDNMIQSISERGSVALADIKTSAYDKPTLVNTDIYFKAMGIKTDLISPSYYSIAKVKQMLNTQR